MWLHEIPQLAIPLKKFDVDVSGHGGHRGTRRRVPRPPPIPGMPRSSVAGRTRAKSLRQTRGTSAVSDDIRERRRLQKAAERDQRRKVAERRTYEEQAHMGSEERRSRKRMNAFTQRTYHVMNIVDHGAHLSPPLFRVEGPGGRGEAACVSPRGGRLALADYLRGDPPRCALTQPIDSLPLDAVVSSAAHEDSVPDMGGRAAVEGPVGRPLAPHGRIVPVGVRPGPGRSGPGILVVKGVLSSAFEFSSFLRPSCRFLSPTSDYPV